MPPEMPGRDEDSQVRLPRRFGDLEAEGRSLHPSTTNGSRVEVTSRSQYPLSLCLYGTIKQDAVLMNSIEQIRDGITERIPEILQQFNTATEVEPWTRFKADHRVVFLGELIALVSDLALRAPGDEDLCRRMLQTAARHGEARREQEITDTLLLSEFGVLRQVITNHLQMRHGLTSHTVIEALIRLDMALSLAAKSALRGYHRPRFEGRGAWPQVRNDLASEWRPPRLVA
jgi:hypothetical protein